MVSLFKSSMVKGPFIFLLIPQHQTQHGLSPFFYIINHSISVLFFNAFEFAYDYFWNVSGQKFWYWDQALKRWHSGAFGTSDVISSQWEIFAKQKIRDQGEWSTPSIYYPLLVLAHNREHTGLSCLFIRDNVFKRQMSSCIFKIITSCKTSEHSKLSKAPT